MNRGLSTALLSCLCVPALAGDPSPSRTDVVFVDASVQDAGVLFPELPSGMTVVHLDPRQDGFSQIAGALKGRRDVGGIHLISHGSPGAIRLGNRIYDESGIEAEGTSLSEIGKALSPGGDFLIYGCEVAEGEKGEGFLRKLAELSGVDVAASTNKTGAAALGGDWVLERQTGSIEAGVAVGPDAQRDWAHLLVAPVLDLDSTTAGNNSVVTYTENGTPVRIVSANTTVTDVDNANMTSASITLANWQAGDVIRIGSATGSILSAGMSGPVGATGVTYMVTTTGSAGSGTFVITLTGSGTKANYETALESFFYQSAFPASTNPANDDPTLGGTAPTRIFNVTVNDGTTDSNVAVATVNIAAVNDGPGNIMPPGWNTPADTPLILDNLQITDVDAGPGTMTVRLNVPAGTLSASSAAGVTVTGSGTGLLTLAGSRDAINVYLASNATAPAYTPTTGTRGDVALGMEVNDGGNTGSGGAKTATTSAPIHLGTLNPNARPLVDLNSPQNLINAATNGAFNGASNNSVPNWQVSTGSAPNAPFTGTWAVNGAIGWVVDNGVEFAQQNVTGLSSGPGASGAARIMFGLSWNNINLASGVAGDNLFPTTLDVMVGGVLYARLTTGVGNLNGTITYFNGAIGNIGSLPGQTSQATNFAPVQIDLPAAVANSGVLRFQFSSANGTGGGDDIWIDNVVVNTYQDAQAGRDFSATYTENGATVRIADGPTNGDAQDSSINDANVSQNMVSGTIVLTNKQANDLLSLNGTTLVDGATGTLNGINYTVVDNGTTITITMTGSATTASYSGFIQAVGFGNSSDNPNTAVIRDVAVTVNDGTINSNTAHSLITVVAVNDPPVDGDETNTVTEDTTLTVPAASGLLANTTDVDGGTPSVTQFVIGGVTTTVPAGGAGTRTITGVGTITINSDGSYSFAPVANYTGAIPAITYTVSDGAGGTDTSALTLTMQVVNDPPVLDLDANNSTAPGTGYTRTYTDGQASTSVADSDVTVADADDTNMESALIVLTNAQAGDQLNVGTLPAGITAVVDTTSVPGQVIVTLSGSASLANYQTAIRAVGFRSTQSDPSFGGTQNSRTIHVTVNDGDTDSNTAVSTMNIVVRPKLAIPSQNVTEDNSGQQLVFNPESIVGPQTPSLPATLTFSVAQTAAQVTASGGPGTLTAASAGGVTVTGSGTSSITLTGTIADINAYLTNPATTPAYTQATPDFNGAVGNFNAALTTSLANDNQQRSLNILALSDIRQDQATTPEDTPKTFNILTGANETIGADSWENSAPQVTAINGGALPTAGSPLTVFDAATPTRVAGTVVVAADGTVTFTPATDYSGTVAPFSYTVTSGGRTETANVNITVTPVNDPPVDGDETNTLAEDSQLVVPAASGLLANASDIEGNPLAIATYTVPGVNGGAPINAGTPAVIPNVGALLIRADGSYTFTPVANYNGPVPVATYTVSDGQGGTDTSTLSLTVTPVDDNPIAVADSFTTPEDTPVTIPVLANDSSPDGPSTITAIDGQPVTVGTPVPVTGGTVTVNPDSTVTFTPDANFNGNPSFTYTVTDPDGDTSTATVSGTVTPVSDEPIAAADTFTTPEDTPVTIPVLANDSSPDGPSTVTAIDGEPVTVGTPIQVAGGTAVLNPDGTITFTPTADFNGTPSFTYTVTDPDGDTSTATIGGTVTPVDDIAADSLSTVSGHPVSFNMITGSNGASADSFENPGRQVTAINGEPLTPGVPVEIFDTGDPSVPAGTVTVAADGSVTFNPAPGYVGTAQYTYTVTSGGVTESAPVTIDVEVNQGPTAAEDVQTVTEDTPATGNVLANDTDPENDPLTVLDYTVEGINGGNPIAAGTPVTIPGVGNLVIRPDGSYTFTPEPNYDGPIPNIVYTVGDGQGNTDTAPLVLTMDPVDDVPVAVADSFTTPEDTPVTIPVLGNDSSPDGPPSITAINGQPVTIGTPVPVTGGTVTVNPGGTVTFTPDANFNGNPSFTYTVTDPDGDTSTATVSGTVTPVDEAPVAANDQVATSAGQTVSGNLASNDTPSPDGGNIWAVDTQPAHGTVTVNPDGTFSYTPAAGFSGTDSFTYTLTDADGDTSTATVTVNVTADHDGDGIPDADDLDDDNDGIPDTVEIANALNGGDTDGDGIPDYLDLDSDNDGIFDVVEAGHTAVDADHDGRADGPYGPNGLVDTVETAPESGVINYVPRDTDGDGRPDYLDLDSDNDSISDLLESGNGSLVDVDHDGLVDGTPDGNGLPPGSGPVAVDADSDGLPDYRDVDSNGDGIFDIVDNGYSVLDPDGDGRIDDTTDIADNDGIPDGYDSKVGIFGGFPAAGCSDWNLTHPSDTDGDVYPADQEYAFGGSPVNGDHRVEGTTHRQGLNLHANASGGCDLSIIRPRGRYDVEFAVVASSDLATWTELAVTPEVTDNGDGTDTLTWSDLQQVAPLSADHGYVRLKVATPCNPAGSYTLVQGWFREPLTGKRQTYGVPFVSEAVLSGRVDSASGTTLTVTTSGGGRNLQEALPAPGRYYLEFTDGAAEGHRIDLSVAASGVDTLGLDLASPNNTTSVLPAGAAGSHYVVRRHRTLGELFPNKDWNASTTPGAADQVLLYNGSGYDTYWNFAPLGGRWVKQGDGQFTSRNDLPVASGTGMFVVHAVTNDVNTMLQIGDVRYNDFRRPLSKPESGLNFTANGYPLDATPASLGMTAANGFTASNTVGSATQILVWNGDGVPNATGYDTSFLLAADGSWRRQGSLANTTNAMLFLHRRGTFVDVQTPKADWVHLLPWNPAPWAQP